ncbi:amidohydrolase family protein [Ruminococcus sp. OA3]|uniref:amidohydrolase family protein n=1 Tax=Ruminococcus sp. OA3 TaxID=2914164 RepID=UPI001F054D40|nr:amidohydrolase family protein [Ruminococcus sp. OA3]MCH1983629.1 amidohydrolase family protein [Ruminococcus sp. OA3]
MRCDCHVHVFMDGLDYRKAAGRHRDGVDESVIRSHLGEYQKHHITYLRDGGDALFVSLRARAIAPEYGITYRTPVFAIHKNGHYGSIVGRGFDTMEEYAQLVREVRRLGGDFIKIMTTGIMDFTCAGKITGEALSYADVKEMVHIAHEEGFAVMAHTNSADAVRTAALCGVDSIEHGNYQDEDSIAAMADSGTVWVPTLVTVRNLLGKGRFTDEVLHQIADTQTRGVQMALEKGVQLATGTDAGAWMVMHGTSLDQEYASFYKILGETEDVKRKLGEGNQDIFEKFKIS